MTAEEHIMASDRAITHPRLLLSLSQLLPHPGKYAGRHTCVGETLSLPPSETSGKGPDSAFKRGPWEELRQTYKAAT